MEKEQIAIELLKASGTLDIVNSEITRGDPKDAAEKLASYFKHMMDALQSEERDSVPKQ